MDRHDKSSAIQERRLPQRSRFAVPHHQSVTQEIDFSRVSSVTLAGPLKLEMALCPCDSTDMSELLMAS